MKKQFIIAVFISLAGISFHSPAHGAAAPLHVEGPFLKNPAGQTVILRGINRHGFLDVPDGAWDPPGAPLYSGMGNWNPAVIREALEQFRRMGFNVIRFHTNVEWWKTNPKTYRDPYRNVTYERPYRSMIEDVIRWAGECDLYVIFNFYALQNTDGRQSGQETLPWHPWGRLPGIVKDRDEFLAIWVSVVQSLGRHPNVLFELYNEPHGDSAAEVEWFQFVEQALPAIRKHTQNPVIVQWDYGCWVNLDYPPPQHSASTLAWIENHPLKDSNVVYGTHLYRNSGGGGPGMVHKSRGELLNLWERADIEKALAFARFPEIIRQARKPLIVTEIGACLKNEGDDRAREIAWLKNVLSLLNELEAGYVGWAWQSDRQLDHGMLHEGKPNEAGMVLLDSLKAVKSGNRKTD